MENRGRKKLPEGEKKIIRTYTIKREKIEKVQEKMKNDYPMNVSKLISEAFDIYLDTDNQVDKN